MASKKRYCITASAFDSKGRLICTRTNLYNKTHPLQKHFAMLSGEPYKEALHAEIACLIAAKDAKVHSMTVIRYDGNGNLKQACPCKTCKTAIESYGVKKVYYSTPNGMEELK